MRARDGARMRALLSLLCCSACTPALRTVTPDLPPLRYALAAPGGTAHRVRGVELWVSDSDPTGEKPAVVCLHAIGHGGSDFARLEQTLGARWRLVLVDWPGQTLETTPTSPSPRGFLCGWIQGDEPVNRGPSEGVTLMDFVYTARVGLLELKMPHEPEWHALLERWPVFLSYVLSFVYVGIYWGNHHHLVHSVKRVTPGVIWANLHLLFWLSVVPFVTEWLGETRAAPVPTAVYSAVMLLTGFGYQILQMTIARQQDEHAGLVAHARNSRKGLASFALDSLSTVFAFFAPLVSLGLVALVWLVPERAFEKISPAE